MQTFYPVKRLTNKNTNFNAYFCKFIFKFVAKTQH